MKLKRHSKVESTFQMSSMTDIVFLLLVFFMVTSTLVSPNALKLLLPRSNSQTAAKPITTVSITSDLQFYVADRSVPVEEVVKVMNIAKDNHYKLILATSPLPKN